MSHRANWIDCQELPSGAMLLTVLNDDGSKTNLAFIIPYEERENVAIHLLPNNVRIHYAECDCRDCAPEQWGIQDA